MEWRASDFASALQQILRGPQADAPFDGAAEEQPSAATLADEQAGERRGHAEDAAEDEPTLAADLALDPAARRSGFVGSVKASLSA